MKTAAVLTCIVAATAALPSSPSSKGQNQQLPKPSLKHGTQQGFNSNGNPFRLHQKYNENFKARDAVHEFYTAHSKYGVEATDAMRHAITKNPRLQHKFTLLRDGNFNEQGTVTAKPVRGDYDSEYVIPIQIGSPPQTVPINLDTGSADLWVFSTDTYAPDVHGQALYRPSDSSSSHLLANQSWKVLYGDGSGASGIVYLDKVAVGGVSYDKQAVQVAVQVSQGISADSASSGILGLASGRANTIRPNQQLTFLDNVMTQLKEPLFTANLQKGAPGNYDFGYVDRSAYDGDIAYTPISLSTPYWQIFPSGYQVGSGKFTSGRWTSIVDTGTSLLMVPQNIVDDYYMQVNGSFIDRETAMVMIPCNADLPDFHFGIEDSYRGLVPGHYMNYAPQSPGSANCYGGMQSSDGIPFGVIGDILLKAQFVVFNKGNMSVGFANKKTLPKSPTPLPVGVAMPTGTLSF